MFAILYFFSLSLRSFVLKVLFICSYIAMCLFSLREKRLFTIVNKKKSMFNTMKMFTALNFVKMVYDAKGRLRLDFTYSLIF